MGREKEKAPQRLKFRVKERNKLSVMASHIRSSICPECGKEFYPAPQHAYVISGKKYCRYNCYNAVLKRKEAKRRKYNMAYR